MATRNKRTSRNSTRETTSRTTHGVDHARLQDAAQQSSQQHFALAADTASTMLRAAEIWSQVQLQAVQRSSRAWRQAAERMRAAASPLDVIAAQNQFLMDTMLQFMQIGQDLVQASAGAQAAAADVAEEEAKAASATAQASMQEPIMQAWQAMVNPLGLMNYGALNGSAGRAAH